MNNEGPLQQHAINKKGSRFLAIFVGFIVDVGGSFLIGIIFAIGYAIVMAANGLQVDQIMTALNTIDSHPTYSAILNLVGCMISVLGGYLCARIVNYSEYKYAAILAAIESLYGLTFVLTADSPIKMIVLIILSAGSVMLGSCVRVWLKRKKIKRLMSLKKQVQTVSS
ncbi:MAG: hypothetical protein GY874_18195 [Desulfobacteraceae bacterium]|nr:hypothetical protein [Desulfobacteraceae bacterium]